MLQKYNIFTNKTTFSNKNKKSPKQPMCLGDLVIFH